MTHHHRHLTKYFRVSMIDEGLLTIWTRLNSFPGLRWLGKLLLRRQSCRVQLHSIQHTGSFIENKTETNQGWISRTVKWTKCYLDGAPGRAGKSSLDMRKSDPEWSEGCFTIPTATQHSQVNILQLKALENQFNKTCVPRKIYGAIKASNFSAFH